MAALKPLDAQGHDEALDAFRGLAALVVLVGHLAQVFWTLHVAPGHALVHAFATASRHAVLVFFLLSGYLIADGIRRNRQRHRGFALRPYASARLARLLPPLAGALALTALTIALHPAGPVPAASTAEYLGALVFLRGLEQANPVLWSLYIEARLYLLAGLVAVATAGGRGALPAGVAALVIGAACVAENPLFTLFAGVWALGAATALLPPAAQRVRRGLCLAAVVVVVMLLASGQAQRLSILEPRPLVNAAMQALAALAYTWLLFDRRWPAALLALPARAASFSYTLYLVHWPLLVWLAAWMQPSASSAQATRATIAGAVLALAAAWALARALEQPARFRRWIEAVLPPPPGALR